MSWDHVIGQTRAKALLRRSIQRNQVAHAYLFHGQEGVGKDALAVEFAKTLLCNKGGDESCGECSGCRRVNSFQHPNVQFICALPTGKGEKSGDDPILVLQDDQVEALQEQLRRKAADPYYQINIPKAVFIKVNSIRQIRRDSSLTSAEKGKKVFLISNADQMNMEAANSLLKTLEEPPPNTVLVLTTSQKEQLLPTIISRCQTVQCGQLSEEEIASALRDRDGADLSQASLAAKLAQGSYAKARGLLSVDILQARQSVVTFVKYALSAQRAPLLNAVEEISKTMDRDAAIRWLKLLQIWFRDALILREQGISAVQNRDLVKDLESFAKKFPNADLVRCMESVERSIALVDKNVYLSLVFTTLAIELHAHSYAQSLFSYS
jgi:DNA polymerase-3 subunit delta'